jgi:uncharacterized protein YwgA
MSTNLDKVIACLKYLEVPDKIGTYRGRFYTQKTAFLAKALGIGITYPFTVYVAGPYSPNLTCEYYANSHKVELLETNYELSHPETEILDKIKLCKGIYQNMSLMEATSTIVYLRKETPTLSDDDVFVQLKRLKPYLNDSDRLIGITRSKEMLFRPEYLTDEIKREMELWDNIE